MAINLITGVPGAGKTLYTLCFVKALAEKDKRPVYYHGINDLALPWIQLEKPEEWFKCPPNSIIVLDECQRVFRLRANGSVVPEHVSRLETHRHQGLDLFVITQHPMLIDTNVRRLIELHFHVRRAFGMQKATVHEFKEVRPNPDQQRQGSIRHDFVYPKEAFKYYHSAEVHTHKRRIPARVWFLLGVPVVVLALGFYGVRWFQNYIGKGKERIETAAGVKSAGTVSSSSLSNASRGNKKDDYQWLAEQRPRIVGLPHTAPMYDTLATPVAMPIPAACIKFKGQCACYTEQGTRIAGFQTVICEEIVDKGWFNPYRAREGQERFPSGSQTSSPSQTRGAGRGSEATTLPL